MSKIFGLWRKKEQKRNDPVALWLSGATNNDVILPMGYTSLAKNEDVKKCIHKIADLVSSMTIMLMENTDDGDKRLKNELSKKIDVYPNRNMVRKNFIYRIVSDMLSTGNGVVIPEVQRGLIENLALCNVDAVTFKGDENNYTVNYRGVEFSSDEVLHFVLIPDETHPFRGQGYVQILKDTITNLVQANETKRAFLQSKWKPSVIMKVQSDAEELQDPVLREKILNSYVDSNDMGKPFIIPADEIDVSVVHPLTLNDLAINDGIEIDKRAIASAFGCPHWVLGIGEFDKDSYNNFIASTIMPIAKVIEQELTKKLVYSPNWYFKFNSRSLYQYNIGEMTTHVKELIHLGVINRNEGRKLFDMSPVEGLNQFVVLENYLNIEDIGKQKKLDKTNDTTSTQPTEETEQTDATTE